MRILYGDSSQFQQIGIVPDVRVEPEIEDFVVEEDRVPEKAVEVLDGKLQTLTRTTRRGGRQDDHE